MARISRSVAVPGEPYLALAALALEAAVGYPAALHARMPHPVVWVGRAVSALEAKWNRPQWTERRRRLLGAMALTLLVAGAAGVGLAIERLCGESIVGFGAMVLIATTGLAQRSLYEHVAAVAHALGRGDLAAAREAVAHIVGRDTNTLDASAVSSAAVESLAESFNDGVVAPAFWLLLGGLPALFAYKVINTADSLIGHREERWRAFGWAAARSDDLVNLLPARLAGLLIALAGTAGLRTMWRDARKHASPNAGWPEAAMAGALAVRLGGPATYDGVRHERPFLGNGRASGAGDVSRALRLYIRACGLLWLAVLLGVLMWLR